MAYEKEKEKIKERNIIPKDIEELEQKLKPFGFAPFYFSSSETIPCHSTVQLKQGEVHLSNYLDNYINPVSGWRFIETIRPPETYKRFVEYNKLQDRIGFSEGIKQQEKYLKIENGSMVVDPYQNDPFADILVLRGNGPIFPHDVGVIMPPEGRGGRIPYWNIIPGILPKIAEKIGVDPSWVRLPYLQEFLQCVKKDGLLDFWPEYMVSEWLQDITYTLKEPAYIINAELATNSKLKKPKQRPFSAIFHASDFSSSSFLNLIASYFLANNPSINNSDKYNPRCGFRTVVEPLVKIPA